MMPAQAISPDDLVDDAVDEALCNQACSPDAQSFFLFAGAGSGKTRSLVKVLETLRDRRGKELRLRGQQIAVITYTNAACDEITRRIRSDPLFRVSTIHSWVWELIHGFDADIRSWLERKLTSDIAELQAAQAKGRAGTKASADRTREIEAKQKRLINLPNIRRFTYSPEGENTGSNSLNHSQVLQIASEYIVTRPLMQQLIISRFPFIMVDESQDTNRDVMEALITLEHAHRDGLVVGLFGDTMQRIYGDGKLDLGNPPPEGWNTPAKIMNHRCPKRVIALLNLVRSSVDAQVQKSRSDAKEGHVRLFIGREDASDKPKLEEEARKRMALVTSDPLWVEPGAVKTLTLEHQMAARRMGFSAMFEPLHQIDEWKTGLRDGTLPFLRVFYAMAMRLLLARRNGDGVSEMNVLRAYSPLLSERALKEAALAGMPGLKQIQAAVDDFASVFSGGKSPSFLEVVRSIATTGLFVVPEELIPFVGSKNEQESADDQEAVADDAPSKRLAALRTFLDTPFSQIEYYADYIAGKAPFGTHQGVKGLEFPRVLVVMDDSDAGGFLFSYEKLFSVKDKTKSDMENERTGKETSIDRTRRLFYVTCSRTKDSLALVAYSSKPEALAKYVVEQGWFTDGEIIQLS